MRAALHHHAKSAPASAPTHAASLDAAPTPQMARPAPMHDISGVPITGVMQRRPAPAGNAEAYRAPNRTGLPDRLQAGVEALSGLSPDRVRRQTEPDALNTPRSPGISQHVAAAEASSPAIVQRKVIVGATEYKPYDKKGHTPNGLIRRVARQARSKNVSLQRGWQTIIGTQAKDLNNTTTYKNWVQVIAVFESPSVSAKKKALVAAQDRVIAGHLAGVNDTTKKRARTIGYESQKAIESVRKFIRTKNEYTNTKNELEALAPGPMGLNEVQQTDNSAVALEALGNADMQRLDFDFHGTSIATHGFESMRDRTVNARTMRQPFRFGTVKIGDDVGTYRRMLRRGTHLGSRDNKTLRDLEMRRLPKTSAMLALKRDLYEKRQIPLSEAMAVDSNKSNVEFMGAVSGSGLTNDQTTRMQEQQINSNAHILDASNINFANYPIGYQMGNKTRTTPREVKDALDTMLLLKSKPAKRAFRRKLKRLIASVQEISDYESDSDVSDYDDNDY